MKNNQPSPEALAAIADALLPASRTREEYAQSVATLYRLAVQGTSGSRAAAQLLLSGYNGHNWQMDITDLCLLDREPLTQALIYMECRATLRIEPHDVLADGHDRFMKLQAQWSRLHIENRWQDDCQNCRGTGEVFLNEEDENDERTTQCSECQGSGLEAVVRTFNGQELLCH